MDILGATRNNACLFFVLLCQGYPEGFLPCRISAEVMANLCLCWLIGMHIHCYYVAPVGITIRVISVMYVVAYMLHGSSLASGEQKLGWRALIGLDEGPRYIHSWSFMVLSGHDSSFISQGLVTLRRDKLGQPCWNCITDCASIFVPGPIDEQRD